MCRWKFLFDVVHSKNICSKWSHTLLILVKLYCCIKDQSYETIITIQNNVRIAFHESVSEPYLL